VETSCIHELLLMKMLHPVCCDILTHHVLCCVLRSCSFMLTHSPPPDTTHRQCSHLKLVATELPPHELTTHWWPTVVQHTTALARYVTHALWPRAAGEPKCFRRERAGEAF
jgi:hypothetical protein